MGSTGSEHPCSLSLAMRRVNAHPLSQNLTPSDLSQRHKHRCWKPDTNVSLALEKNQTSILFYSDIGHGLFSTCDQIPLLNFITTHTQKPARKKPLPNCMQGNCQKLEQTLSSIKTRNKRNIGKDGQKLFSFTGCIIFYVETPYEPNNRDWTHERIQNCS